MGVRYCALLLALVPTAGHAADWSLSLSGGIAGMGTEGDQPFVSADIYRYFGAGYIRAGAALFDGEDEGRGAAAIPAETRQLTLGAGYQVGRFLLDGYATVGERDFRSLAGRPGGLPVRLESEGSLMTLGGSVTYDLPVGDRWLIAPFAALGYSAIDTARTLAVGRAEPIIVESREKGVTGIGGASMERLWRGGSVGAYLAVATTSNRATVNRQGSGLLAARAPRLIEGDDAAESWFEYGVSGSLVVSQSVALDAALIRTAGFSSEESTSLSAGIRFAF